MTTYVTAAPVDLAELFQRVTGPGRGGTASFVGTVRAGPDDGPVERIEYSAYEEMLEAEFARIVTEAQSRWPGARATGIHRLGTIGLGEASIAVVAAAPHRAEAFDACRFVVEEAKRRLPVWKKEFHEDGRSRWRENREWASQSS